MPDEETIERFDGLDGPVEAPFEGDLIFQGEVAFELEVFVEDSVTCNEA